MEPWGWVSMIAGGALALAALADVFFTTLHPDVEGRIAATVQRACWRAAVATGRRTGARRQLLAIAGPLMVVLTFTVWITLFVVGIALIVWPHLGAFRIDAELDATSFMAALYFAGVTVTVLGYGDITPLEPGMQTLSWLASGAGFGMLTAVVTYTIELVTSVDQRNRMALKVHDDTGGTEHGVDLVLRYVRAGSTDRLEARYEEWADLARTVQDQLHRFALTSLYYRSRDPAYDPEAMLRVVGEAVAAGYLLTSDARYRSLRPTVEHLDLAATRLLGTIAQQYLGREVMSAIDDPEVGDADHRWLDALSSQMRDGLGEGWIARGPDDRALAIAVRLRHFIAALSRLTHWSPEHGDPPSDDPELRAAASETR